MPETKYTVVISENQRRLLAMVARYVEVSLTASEEDQEEISLLRAMLAHPLDENLINDFTA
jgi:cell division protein ZapA (FtsZ GTPase activity inhibitor)